ncbi:MAG: hypothetical protein LUF33_04815 [Clostridiales bacterium]|nr:hypothetical protein [Clostridiales bacterium]
MGYFVSVSPLLLLAVVIIFAQRTQRQMIIRSILKKKAKEDKAAMVALAKNFIGKDCMVYTLDCGVYTGIIKEVTDGGILLEGKKGTEVINIDYVKRLREYPRNKKGKRKSIVV